MTYAQTHSHEHSPFLSPSSLPPSSPPLPSHPLPPRPLLSTPFLPTPSSPPLPAYPTAQCRVCQHLSYLQTNLRGCRREAAVVGSKAATYLHQQHAHSGERCTVECWKIWTLYMWCEIAPVNSVFVCVAGWVGGWLSRCGCVHECVHCQSAKCFRILTSPFWSLPPAAGDLFQEPGSCPRRKDGVAEAGEEEEQHGTAPCVSSL